MGADPGPPDRSGPSGNLSDALLPIAIVEQQTSGQQVTCFLSSPALVSEVESSVDLPPGTHAWVQFDFAERRLVAGDVLLQ